ncbi:MAG: GldG family protein [Planctomycetota bacterium]
MNTTQKLATGAVLATGIFCAVNILGGTVLSSLRLDLTEEKLYTLSDGARSIARDLDEPITIQYYASEELRDEVPFIASSMRRVEDVLEEFVQASKGKLRLERFHPVENSEAEDEAAIAGLQRISAGRASTEGYFGIVLRNSVGEKQVIPAVQPSQEPLLEYELAQRLVALDSATKPVVGLVTSLPVDGEMPTSPGARPTPEWGVMPLLRRQFDLRRIDSDAAKIDDDVDVLMLLHPHGLPDATLYAIDQFALRGGRIVALVDPFCASDVSSQQQGMQLPPPTDLGPLLASWGLEMKDGVFAADRLRAQTDPKTGEPVLYVTQPTSDDVDADDPVTARLSDLLFLAPGVLAPVDGATTTFTPLVSTTEESAAMNVFQLAMLRDPADLLDAFHPGYEKLAMAARVSGRIKTAFPDGPDAQEPPDEGAVGPEAPKELPEGHLAESQGEFSAIVIADADMIHDRSWMARSMFGTVKLSENVDFVLNALEQLAGSDALLSLRARGTFDRPFEKLRELRLTAQERYREEEKRLEDKLDAAQARIDDIAKEQGDGDTVVITPELQDELEKAYEARSETRKELRRVKLELASDERSLANRIKWIDIGAVPVLVVAAGVVTLTARRRARGKT